MKTPKQILEDDKAPAVVVLAVVIKKYGSSCFEWDPTVLKAELQEDFDCKISDLQSDKIQAAITLLTTDHYESYITAFETFNHLFNNQPHELLELTPLEPEELICGLTEAYQIKHEALNFSPEVRVYAGRIFQDYGMHKPPILFPTVIMDEREGDDSSKNEALLELFHEKNKIIKEYLDNAQIK